MDKNTKGALVAAGLYGTMWAALVGKRIYDVVKAERDYKKCLKNYQASIGTQIWLHDMLMPFRRGLGENNISDLKIHSIYNIDAKSNKESCQK